MDRIIRNVIQCKLCGEVIESMSRHDFVQCKCKCCFIDGGHDYLRRGFTHSQDDYIELSIVESEQERDNDSQK